MDFNQNPDTINHLLKTASPEGAYYLGIVTALAIQDGIVLPVAVLEAAIHCDGPADAKDLYDYHRSISGAGEAD